MVNSVFDVRDEQSQASEYLNERTNDILEVIMSFARLEFQSKTRITANDDVFDAISAGVNMLGEELENTVITIQEKEALLKEVHHRVKNNLQIISSLLNLQADYSNDPHFIEMIRECKNRVTTMAIIHEMLYLSRDFSCISAREYLSKLCESIHSSFRPTDINISFSLNVSEHIMFDSECMIPLGLIVNEILSNSMKYAFPEGTGIVCISLTELESKKFLLEVGDNGIGLPESFDLKNAPSLGIQLLYALSEQLEGKLSVCSKQGTKYQMEFSCN